MNNARKTCCFFGHRKIEKADSLKIKVYEVMESLILYNNVDTFLMGSKSDFDCLCRNVLSELKEKYTHIRRIYVRAEYPDISDDYESYLLESCEETYFPDRAKNAGKAVYVERNCEMIDNAGICVVYFKDDYLPPKRKNSRRDLLAYQPKSGTEIAYQYAVRKKKMIINVAVGR